MQQAKPAAQIIGRQAHRGGWPLGFTTAACPAEVPVGCQSSPSYNLNCCPSGQFCFGTQQPYCCPTDDDCGPAVKNIPVCANSSWNMFQNKDVRNHYFCCPSGYIGVTPARGEAGVCELEGVNVPKSQLATTASQIGFGGTSTTPFTEISSAALTRDEPPTFTGTGITAVTSATTTEQETQDDRSNAGSNSPISIGAIAGISVGAAAALAIAFALVMWWHRRSLRNSPPPAGDHQTASGSGPSPQENSKPAGEMQAKQTGFAQPDTPTPAYGYSAPYVAYEVPATSRVEMEAPADGMGYNTAPRPM